MTEHYFTESPKSKLIIHKLKVSIKGKEIEFYTASGLFSPKRIDKGTELLISNCIPKEKVLDLGCGYGIIGISLLILNPKLELTFSDINERAIEITKKNIELNKLKAEAIQSDGFKKIKNNFNTILLNPPQTAGKKLCLNLIEESKKFLKKEGTLQIVARHNKGGRELENKMLEVFSNVREIAKKSGYRVYISQNS